MLLFPHLMVLDIFVCATARDVRREYKQTTNRAFRIGLSSARDTTPSGRTQSRFVLPVLFSDVVNGPGARALRCRLLWGWLLLRHAVQCAEPPDQISAVDADDLAVGEEVSEDVEGEAVVGIVEDGNENEAIGNVEIGVAGGEAASFEEHWAGRGEFDDGERLAILVGGGAEAADVFAQRLVVGVVGVGFDDGDDGVRRDEASEIIDVAVGVVAGDAGAEPDHVLDSQIIRENLFVVGSLHGGIAWLDLAKQALFGSQKSALAVDLDGAALEHDRVLAVNGAGFVGAGGFGHEATDFFVVLPVGVLGPGVEAPFDGGKAGLRGWSSFFLDRRIGTTKVVPFPAFAGGGARATLCKGAARVAGPDAIGGPAVKAEVVAQSIRTLENFAGASFRGRVVD